MLSRNYCTFGGLEVILLSTKVQVFTKLYYTCEMAQKNFESTSSLKNIQTPQYLREKKRGNFRCSTIYICMENVKLTFVLLLNILTNKLFINYYNSQKLIFILYISFLRHNKEITYTFHFTLIIKNDAHLFS